MLMTHTHTRIKMSEKRCVILLTETHSVTDRTQRLGRRARWWVLMAGAARKGEAEASLLRLHT